MSEELQPGLYEDIVTAGLRARLELISGRLISECAPIEISEIPSRLSRHLARILLRALESMPDTERVSAGPRLVQEIISHANSMVGVDGGEIDFIDGAPRFLSEVSEILPDGSPRKLNRPLTPLVDTTLLTNISGEPSLQHELKSEIDSANSISIVMAFVRWTGIRELLPIFKQHIDRGRKVQLLTTIYTNSV